VLVDGVDAWVEGGEQPAVGGERAYLTRQHYAPDLVTEGAEIESFEYNPWPRWTYRLRSGVRIEHELFVPRGVPAVALRWQLVTDGRPDPRPAGRSGNTVPFRVRPFLSGRDFHALHHENSAFRFAAAAAGGWVTWHPYPDVPTVSAISNGEYAPDPVWYRGFLCAEERDRGLDHVEDLAAPGVFAWDLARQDAVLLFTTDPVAVARPDEDASAAFARLRSAERQRRARFAMPLHRAADAYLVRRGEGRTIIAGYPWFGDWGRDTFIALRGLCLATGRLAEARDILLEWAGQVSAGMLPNRFADAGDAPEFNAVDASLWYVVAVHEYLQAAGRSGGRPASRSDCIRLQAACKAIVAGYANGTRYRIHLDGDGLLAAGEPGVQLTWMDAKVGDWVVTPRVGKPVEVQALWLNALRIVSAWDPAWREPYERGHRTFGERFWNPEWGWLNDVVDPDHQPGAFDATLRPNQILAAGGLPYPVLDLERARRVVDVVETNLWTPVGLRSLAPADPRYVGRYLGGVRQRDGSYHQGTVWPWLLGPFVEAWVRVRGDTAGARRAARERFLGPLLRHLDEAGLGHVSEIANAAPPHPPRGCPFQAWSVGEAIRLDLVVLRTGDD
ncbi:MAG TPA: amylo-alpha-1,6-glucosidase, partial [Gemmatimonadales bacterium]|nr:amylo-alpha-1,6-glucosidase [Gemmatimonadales bacterium]